jgi:hypothetical protein
MNPREKSLNRQGAKNAMVSKAQKLITVLNATAPRSVLENSNLKSARGSLGGPRWRLGGERFFSDWGEE